MLAGLLVDLVPQTAAIRARDYVWRNSEARYWTSGGDRTLATRAQNEAAHRGHAEARQPNVTPVVFFGVQDKRGVPVGFFGIADIAYHNRTGMLAARIGEPDYWGGGYGTDALLLLVEYAFNWLDLRRVHLQTMSTNERVHRQMAKVGFVREGEQRAATYADGAWCSWVFYGMLRAEWPGRAALVERLGLREKAARVYGRDGLPESS